MSDARPVVYLLTCVPSGKRYVGICKSTATKRFKRHCTEAGQGSKLFLHRAIRKYGKASFTVDVIATADDWEQAKLLERSCIAEYGTFAPAGFNMTEGGEGTVGYQHREDSRAAMSQKHTGKVVSAESRKRMSESKAGVAKEPETRARMSLGARRRHAASPEESRILVAKMHAGRRLVDGPLSDAHKAKLSAATKGRKQSPQEIAARLPPLRAAMALESVRARISAGITGRAVSTETREKMSESCRAALSDPAVKAKISAANASREWSDSARAKIGTVHRGKPKSPETRERMRLAALRNWAKRRDNTTTTVEG